MTVVVVTILAFVGGAVLVAGALGSLALLIFIVWYNKDGNVEDVPASIFEEDAVAAHRDRCPITPPGWEQCTRQGGHEGPCAHERRPDAPHVPS